MFNRKNLDGWTVVPAKAAKAWTVKDGVIHGNGDHGRSYLQWDRKDIGFFEMVFEYRFPGKGNSGVNIRAVPDETGRRLFKSYHADLGHKGIGKHINGAWDFHTPGRREHACHRGDLLVIDKDDKPTVTKLKDAVTLDDIKKGDWNEARIMAVGNKYVLWINGKISSQFVEHLPDEKQLKKGAIQLQLHDPGMIVEFRNLRFRKW